MIIDNIPPAIFGLENLPDEKDIYPYLHRKMFGRHISFLGFHLWIGNVFLHLYNLNSLYIEEMNIITIEGSSMISLITSISKIKIHFKTLLDQMSAQRQRMRREEHKRALRELLEERQRRRLNFVSHFLSLSNFYR